MRTFFGWCAAAIATVSMLAPVEAKDRPIGVLRDGGFLVADVRNSDGTPVVVVGDVKPAELDSPWIYAVVAGLPTAHGYPPQGSSYDGKTNPAEQYFWRWIGLEAPHLVVEVVAGPGETWFVPESDLLQLQELAPHLPNVKPLPTDDSLVAQLVTASPCNVGRIAAVRVVTDSPKWQASLTAALEKAKLTPPPARMELQGRSIRKTKTLVGQLLKVYGQKLDPVAYIPALAVLGRVRQEKIDGGPDAPLSPLVQEIVKPYLDGTKKTFDGKAGGSGLAGHLLFGELATLTGDNRYVQLVLNAANQAFDKDGKPLAAMPSHSEMSDAVFMGCPILAQAARLTGDEKYAAMCLTHLRFMQKLCLREDGLYRHSPLDQAAWGRGNGFPALGLCWSLDELPESFAGREEILKAHRAHLETLLKHQDATGMWHQVIDHPESYREFTATAMIAYAMMRGVRSGRLEKEKYADAIERAWAALKLRIAADGTLVDVCTGTGKMPNLRVYYDRPAILGRDDRGGAMALMAATEREQYEAMLVAALGPRPASKADFALQTSKELKPTRTVVYKKVGDRELELHLFLPDGWKASDRRPCFLAVHGGGWYAGAPPIMYCLTAYLAKRGWVAVSMRYRLHDDEAKTTVFDCVRDGRSAMRYLRSHAAEFGIDSEQIVMGGRSAGGHVSAATALCDGLDEASDSPETSCVPNALALFSPVIDTSDQGYGNELIGKLWRELSPLHRVRPGSPPTIVFHGVRDTITPFAGARAFVAAMDKAGNRCELVAHPSGGHSYMFRTPEIFAETMDRLMPFLAAAGIKDPSTK